ncbi:hypothetical protein ABPG75_013972 [Micractinium tetrahymenae]
MLARAAVGAVRAAWGRGPAAVRAPAGRAAPRTVLHPPTFRLGGLSQSAVPLVHWGLEPRLPRRRSAASHQHQRAGPAAADIGSSDEYTDGYTDEEQSAAAVMGAATSAATGPSGNGARLIGEPRSAAGSAALSSSDEETRWHDAMQRALMNSLQLPRADHPTWWGKRFHGLQRRMAEVLESREAHYLVIGLVLLDLAIVLTELVLSSFYPTPELAPHIVHVAEEALSYTSITILAVFNAELIAKLLVFGFKYFTHSSWHMFDAVVVVTSFTLELSLRGVAQEVASLLIFFRLWRIMRIMHGVAEAMELNHSQELQRLQLRNQQLETEVSVSQQRLLELQQQVALLNVAAAAKGLDLPFILSTAASQQQQLATTAQQQLLAAAAATASKGMELQTILAAAAAQQQQVAATAQQQLLAAATAAAAAGAAVPGAAPAVSVASGASAPLLNGEAAAAAVAAALSHHDGHSHRGSTSSSSAQGAPADKGNNSGSATGSSSGSQGAEE